MSLNDQKNLSRRALQMWGSNSSERPEDIVAENYINHQEPDVEGGVTTKSLQAWKDLLRSFHDGFSNSRIEVTMQIAEGDLVASRFEITATHTGSFVGVAPTNKELTWTGVAIDRLDNSKIVESWVDWDKYRFYEGLGLAKQP